MAWLRPQEGKLNHEKKIWPDKTFETNRYELSPNLPWLAEQHWAGYLILLMLSFSVKFIRFIEGSRAGGVGEGTTKKGG